MKEECDNAGPCYALRAALRGGYVYRVAEKDSAAVHLRNGARLAGCPWCLCDSLNAAMLARWPWLDLAPQPTSEEAP